MSITRNQASGAYQRWNPPAFDGEPEDALASPESEPTPVEAAQPAPAPAEPEEPQIKLPTADDIEAMFEQARQDGERTGYDEGRSQAANEAAAQARELTRQVSQLIRSMDDALDRLGGDVAEEIVALSIALASQMVGENLRVHPESIVTTVREALHQMPQGKVRVFLHPDDLQLVREHLEDPLDGSHHHLIEDPALERGGCRLEAAGCDIDATVSTRWQRVLAGIGRKDDEHESNA